MTQTAQVRSIAFTYAPTGEVTCSNTAGLTFFLFAEAPGVKPSAEAAPSRPAPGWTQVEATMEVAVRRAAEPQAIAELARVAPVPAASFTPMEAILSATAQGGEIMGQPGELGKVQAGYLADLILIDGDPLSDIAILQDRNKLKAIMKDGAFHKEPADSAA